MTSKQASIFFKEAQNMSFQFLAFENLRSKEISSKKYVSNLYLIDIKWFNIYKIRKNMQGNEIIYRLKILENHLLVKH